LLTVFNEVAEIARVSAAANGNVFEAECDAEVGVAYVDPLRLRQCMLHLTSNAAKFTKNGRISLRMSAPGDGQVMIVVSDTGVGMSEATVSRLFQPFVQADASTTRRYGGTGLGLAISQRFAELLGGRIELTSKVGEGSTFRLVLPVVAPSLAAGSRPSAA